MTLRKKAEKLVLTYEEDFDLSSKEQRYTGLVLRIEQVLRKAKEDMRETCALTAYGELVPSGHDQRRVCRAIRAIKIDQEP